MSRIRLAFAMPMLLTNLICLSLVVDPAGGVVAPLHAYNGVGRPLPVDVAPVGDDAASAALVLLDAAGTVLAGPITCAPGRVDLAEMLPAIWELRAAGYVQVLSEGAAGVAGEPVGSPLVVQPMLSRMVPVAEEAINPSGLKFTRIVGWRHELVADKPAGDAAKPDDTKPAEPEPERPLLLSGLRVYPERDVVLRTSAGSIRLAMRPDQAPNTVWNFLSLCQDGFYEGVIFHRIVPMTRGGDPFVIQAGDPTGTGDGGPGYWLPLERSALPHDFGVISMARDVPPDSAGSQFFIGLSRAGTSRLDGNYCAFGEAVDGADVIKAIAGVELADPATGRPKRPPVIEGADLVPAPPRAPGKGRPDRPLSAQTVAAPPLPGRVPR